MQNLTPETKELLNLIKEKSKMVVMVAMVAPSFLIDFHYPEMSEC